MFECSMYRLHTTKASEIFLGPDRQQPESKWRNEV